MAALSAVVFSLSWWLGLYLLARDPRKPVLVLAAIGLTSFASVVALDAVRIVSGSDILSSIEIYLVAVPGIAWFAVLLELSRPCDTWRSRAGEIALVAGVAAVAFFGAAMAGNVDGPAAAGPLGDVRGDLAVLARRDGQRGVRGGRSPGRWRASW